MQIGRTKIIRGLAAILCISGASWLILDYFVPAPPSRITIATAFKGASFDYFGRRYRERLGRIGIKVELRETAGALENLRLLQNAETGIQVGFVTGGVSDGNHAPELQSLGPVFVVPFWVFYSSKEPLNNLSQLKGKRIAVGPAGSGGRYTAERILKKSGINSETATLLPSAGSAAVDALKDGKIDAAWIIAGPDAPAVQALLVDPAVRLMDFPMAEAYTRIFPDLVRLVLPQGVMDFDRPSPSSDVQLIGTTASLLIRSDLHPAIVELLSQTLKEEHGGPGIFQRNGEFPKSIDPDYPMSPIALDYYRSGPWLLEKYLPFWMIIYAKRSFAVLFAVFAIVLPILNYAPKLYVWLIQERLRKLYRRLRIVDEALQKSLTGLEAEALQKELADIDRAASSVPMHESDLFFDFRQHMDRTRSYLASRLAEARAAMAE